MKDSVNTPRNTPMVPKGSGYAGLLKCCDRCELYETCSKEVLFLDCASWEAAILYDDAEGSWEAAVFDDTAMD